MFWPVLTAACNCATYVPGTSGPEDQSIVAPLHIAQTVLGQPNAVRRVTVSALTKPEDAFARKDPSKMPPAM